MLNNITRKNIYDNYKLIFHNDKLHDDKIIPNKLTIIAVILNKITS